MKSERPRLPEGCPYRKAVPGSKEEGLVQLINRCWHQEQARRPDFDAMRSGGAAGATRRGPCCHSALLFVFPLGIIRITENRIRKNDSPLV